MPAKKAGKMVTMSKRIRIDDKGFGAESGCHSAENSVVV
jgi:hypothetical protein